jgi:hypothetical protein
MKMPCVLLSLLAGVLAGLTAFVLAAGSTFDVLTERKMSNVGGAAPACTANHSYYPCSEAGTGAPGAPTCWQNDGNQANCNPNLCVGCDGSGQNDKCGLAKPWNSLCDTSKGSIDARGCGSYFDPTTSSCMWNGAAQTCRCAGTVPVNATACSQWKIVDNPTTCTIVP